MKRIFAAAVLACLTVVTTSITMQAAGADPGGQSGRELPAHGERAVCALPGGPNSASCHAKVVTASDGVTPLATNSYTYGYRPVDLASAYLLPDPTASATWAWNGQTVAIVDAYHNPNAAGDLAVYRHDLGLPPCDTTSGCFRQVNQNGQPSPLPSGNTGWGQEIALDVDMASAICPMCKILLVEANSNSFADLGTAVNRAVTMGANAVSNSYGTNGEFTGETSYDSYYNHPGVAVTVSSGDAGYGVEYPAASRYVVAVGGTSLYNSSAGSAVRTNGARTWSESVWSGAGSGCSTQSTKPVWQTDSGCLKRTVADVSAVADPNTGVAVYDSYGSSGGANWYVFGGTSVSSPIIASVFALAGSSTWASYSSTVSKPAQLLYSTWQANSSSLFDVTTGNNGRCTSTRGKKTSGAPYLCTGGVGYDGPTGLGTPNGLTAF